MAFILLSSSAVRVHGSQSILEDRYDKGAHQSYLGTERNAPVTNLRFADVIDGLAGEEEELATLTERLDKASAAYGMEIGAEKT